MLLGNKPGRIPAVLSMLSQSVPGECWANSDRRFCFVLFCFYFVAERSTKTSALKLFFWGLLFGGVF